MNTIPGTDIEITDYQETTLLHEMSVQTYNKPYNWLNAKEEYQMYRMIVWAYNYFNKRRKKDEISRREVIKTLKHRKYDFKKDVKAIGYENKFTTWLLNQGMPKELIEFTPAQYKQWDLNICGITYEIKRDKWYKHTGNLLIEDMYNLEGSKEGWFRYSMAKWLVVFVDENKFYAISLHQLREYYKEHKLQFKKMKIWQDKGEFTTINYVIPIKKLGEMITWVQLEGKETETNLKR